MRLPSLLPKDPTFRRRLRTGVAGVVALYLAVGCASTRIHGAPETVPALDGFPWAGPEVVVQGALSVHTGRSHDAKGSFEQVADAAARTGLEFVVMGDHAAEWTDEGLSAMDAQIQGDVLLVPGLELAIAGIGRTLVVGLDTLPRRWEGTVESLTGRVDSLGGFTSVVHGRSPKSNEDWEGLDPPGAHAYESFDVSEMARKRLGEIWGPYHIASLVGSLMVGRGHHALTGLWREGTSTPALAAYDSIRAIRPMTLTGGLNHHPKLAAGSILFPAYEPFFRTVVNHVLLPGALPPSPSEAREELLEALRGGNLFVSLGPEGDANEFRFRGRVSDSDLVPMGSGTGWGGDALLEIQLPGRVEGTPLIRILKDGAEVVWLEAETAQTVQWPVPGPGIYRVEVFRAGPRIGGIHLGLTPWIISNPVEFYGAPS